MLFVLGGCQERGSGDNQAAQRMDLNPLKTDKVTISDIVSDFYFLPLNLPEGEFFATPDKLTIVNDRIYILDMFQGLKLLVFDMRGNFKFQLSNYGRGPGEFIEPNDFVIDTLNNRIAIFDSGNLKVSFFTLEKGDFIKDYPLTFLTSSFEKTKEGYVFYNVNLQGGENNNNVVFTDNNFKIINGFLPVSSEQANFHFGLPRNFTRYGEDVYLTIPFDNTIYLITDNQMQKNLPLILVNQIFPMTFLGPIKAPEKEYGRQNNMGIILQITLSPMPISFSTIVFKVVLTIT